MKLTSFYLAIVPNETPKSYVRRVPRQVDISSVVTHHAREPDGDVFKYKKGPQCRDHLFFISFDEDKQVVVFPFIPIISFR